MDSDVKVMDGGVSFDDRGCVRFVNDFNFDKVKRFYQVENHKKGFIRAWHGHKNEAKYVYVARGCALIGSVLIPVDGKIETVSPNETPQKFVLSSENPQVLYIPKNHANGFMTLKEDTIIQFFSTSTLKESLGDDVRFSYDKWNIWSQTFR